jgi:hypothetical protein
MQHQTDADVEAEIARIKSLALNELRTLWRTTFRSAPPPGFTKDLLGRAIAYRIQERAYGGLDKATLKLLEGLARGNGSRAQLHQRLKSGTVMVREYQGERHTVTVIPGGSVWREKTYPSLSAIALAITGTAWNGHRFFGLRAAEGRRIRRAGALPEPAQVGAVS